MRSVEKNIRNETAAAIADPDAVMKQIESTPELMDAFTQKFIEQYGEKIMAQLARQMIGA